jgi:hypothetical protein
MYAIDPRDYSLGGCFYKTESDTRIPIFSRGFLFFLSFSSFLLCYPRKHYAPFSVAVTEGKEREREGRANRIADAKEQRLHRADLEFIFPAYFRAHRARAGRESNYDETRVPFVSEGIHRSMDRSSPRARFRHGDPPGLMNYARFD